MFYLCALNHLLSCICYLDDLTVATKYFIAREAEFRMCSLNIVDMCLNCVWLCHLLQLLMVRISDEPAHIQERPLNTSQVWPLPQNCSDYFTTWDFLMSDFCIMLMQPGGNLTGGHWTSHKLLGYITCSGCSMHIKCKQVLVRSISYALFVLN